MTTLRPLRPYQQRGMDLMRKAYSEDKRKILFWLATGGGKSVIFLHLIAGLLKGNKRVCLVMRRRQLVFQTREHFEKAGIPCSIMMSSQKGYQPLCSLQVCSIDTLSRKDLAALGKFDCVVVDEAHDAVSSTYQQFLHECKENGTELFVGLTATPFKMGKKVHDFWDSCVKPIEMHDLRDLGFLVDCDLYDTGKVDFSGIQIDSKTGDFKQKPLSDMMSGLEVLEDVVGEYRNKGMNRPAICFAVDKSHSISLCMEFNEEGIPAVHCDESTSQKDRDRAIQDLKSGEIKVLCNVNIFSTGVDIPEVEVGIMARPTRSEVLYIQQLGRLLRPFRRCGKCKSTYDNSPKCYVCGYDQPEYIKQRAIILDCGGNTGRHGLPFDVRNAALGKEAEKNGPRKEIIKTLIKTCTKCFMVYAANGESCPGCGGPDTKENYLKTSDGILVPFDQYLYAKNLLNEFDFIQKMKGYKENWKFFQLYKKMGDPCMIFRRELGIPSYVPKFVKEQEEREQKGMMYR